MSAVVGEAVFWIAVISCAIAQLAILRAVLRTRAAEPPVPPTGAALPRVRRGAEILWAVLPALLLALVLVLTWREMHPRNETPPARAASPATGDFR